MEQKKKKKVPILLSLEIFSQKKFTITLLFYILLHQVDFFPFLCHQQKHQFTELLTIKLCKLLDWRLMVLIEQSKITLDSSYNKLYVLLVWRE